MEASLGSTEQALKKKSIVIVDLPEEFNHRDVLKQHFEQYGVVERLACSLSKKFAIIHFSSQEGAENALINGNKINPNAAPLKISFSSKSFGTGSEGQKTTVVPTASTANRFVTRRKIIRTFNNPNAVTPSSESSQLPSSNSSPVPHTSQMGASGVLTTSNTLHATSLRSSIKISRPFPFLRKKPSFGDKSGKPSSPGIPRNPFALPPRSMLSLDRRKKSAGGISESGQLLKSQVTQIHSGNVAAKLSLPSQDTKRLSPIPPNDSDNVNETENNDISSTLCFAGPSRINESSPLSQKLITPSVDIDETTVDVTESEILNESFDVEADDSNIVEGETDTQDTAEATTEEEGEILDDDDEENQNDDDDEVENDENDVYESPLKRAEEENKATNKEASDSTPSSSFSFKLASKSNNSTPSSSSLFKLPFTSPFAFGDAPKPFSSTSLGIQLKVPKTSKSSANTGTESVQSVDLVQEKPKEKVSLQTVVRKSEVELEKPKPVISGMLPSGITSTSKPGTSAEMKSSSISKIIPNQLFPKRSGATTSASASLASSSQQAQQISKDEPNPLLLSFNPDTPEAQELFAKRALTIEDRYRILEARDKIIRSRVPKTKVNVEFATKLVGTCPDMCPEKERYMRQFQRQLVVYETLPGPDVAVDHQKAVKAYSRSSADQEEPLPHELRPGPTLDYTMHYLLKNVVPLGDDPDENLSDWYTFLWDRTRSIRKDITQQQITDLTAVSLYEKCTRFHIHCGSRLCELDVHSFDPKLNDENLMKCLQSLEHLYEDLRRRQVKCPNEPEFRAYQIMMNLNEGDALYNAQQLPSWILNSTEVQTALKLHHSIYIKNFVAFFRAVDRLPYMIACILHRYFFQVRSLALRCFIKAHCTLPKYETVMPMLTLQRMLGYGSEEAQSFSYLCDAHGIHCDVDDKRVILKRKLFYLPESPSIYREHHLIDSKLLTSVAEAINGGPLPEMGIRRPHSSYNDSGQLTAGAVVETQGSKSGFQLSQAQPFHHVSVSQTQAFHHVPVSQAQPFHHTPVSTGNSIFGMFASKMPKPAQTIMPGFNFQPRKETQVAKPVKEIDAACDAAATKLINDSVKYDVTKISQAGLTAAKKSQEKENEKKLKVEACFKVSLEWVEQELSRHVNSVVRTVSISKLNQFKTLEEVSNRSTAHLIEESLQMDVQLSARNELKIAKEFYLQKMVALEQILKRLRARIALERWRKFAKTKKQEREMQQEKKRIELWNFPAINPYSSSTSDVFKALCGTSPVQPSISKVDTMQKGSAALNEILHNFPQNVSGRPKRKSEGDCAEPDGTTPKKLPRMSTSYVEVGKEQRLERVNTVSAKLQQELWEFPVSNPYNKTNQDVLRALCGGGNSDRTPISSKMSSFTAPSHGIQNSAHGAQYYIGFEKSPNTKHGRVSEEIKNKAFEPTADFLQNINDFLKQVRQESQSCSNLDVYIENVKTFEETCPDICRPVDTRIMFEQSSIPNSSLYCTNGRNISYETEGMEVDEMQTFQNSVFGPIDLLSEIQNFMREIKEEKAKSWNTETFLNDFDLSIVS